MSRPPRHIWRYPASSSSTAGPGSLDEGEEEDVFLSTTSPTKPHHKTLPQRQTARSVNRRIYSRAHVGAVMRLARRNARVTSRNGMRFTIRIQNVVYM